MADQPRHPGTSDDASTGTRAAPGTARPRWKIALLIVLVAAALALMIVLHATGVVGASTNG
jgi:antibiotic biosynthesis monooxygenase (ABM) superfamily enzyme